MSDASDFMAKIRLEFFNEADDLLDLCEESFLRLEDPLVREEELAKIFRAAHTIKGSGASVGLVDLVEFAHVVEDCLAALRTRPEQLTVGLTSILLNCLDAMRRKIEILRDGDTAPWPVEALMAQLKDARTALTGVALTSEPSSLPRALAEGEGTDFGFFDEQSTEVTPARIVIPIKEAKEPAGAPERGSEGPQAAKKEAGSVKIDAERVDAILDLVGELVVLKSQLINKTEAHGADAPLIAVVTLLDKTVRELQDKALAMRLTPVKPLFLKMQRMARDLSLKMSKPIDFETSGEDTELDRAVVEMLGDPLMHLLRNAVDHGVEDGDRRRAAGKPEKGTVRLTASQVGGRIIVRVSDDGHGICRAAVVRKAIEKGILASEAEGDGMDDQDVYSLILAPGFSTAAVVTDVSGRGVGMDVVRTQVERLKGVLTIDSKAGAGTTFEISLPLTASVTDGMVVAVGASRFVVPMERIRNLVKVDRHAIVHLGTGRAVLNVRGQLLPLVDAAVYLSSHSATPPDSDVEGPMAVVFECQDRLFALRVGGIIGQMQVVMKPMNAAFPRQVVAGAAILGDGQVALVADVDGVVRAYLSAPASAA